LKIRNVNGADGFECHCGSWLEHWLKHSRQALPRYCSEVNCFMRPEVAAHVQKDGEPADPSWYVIPVCRGHYDKKGESFKIHDSIELVPVDGDKS